MTYYFFDTSSLLNLTLEDINNINNTDGKIIISDVSLREIEDIKTSAKKDEHIKYLARQITKWLNENVNKYEVYIYKEGMLDCFYEFAPSNDIRILACAYSYDCHEHPDEADKDHRPLSADSRDVLADRTYGCTSHTLRYPMDSPDSCSVRCLSDWQFVCDALSAGTDCQGHRLQLEWLQGDGHLRGNGVRHAVTPAAVGQDSAEVPRAQVSCGEKCLHPSLLSGWKDQLSRPLDFSCRASQHV